MFIRDSVYSQRTVSDVKSPVSCFSPNLVYNPYLDEKVLVPCRNCAACRYNYSVDLQSRINDECKAHKYNFFFTLTYDNDHLPMYRCYPSGDGDVYFRAFRGDEVMTDENGLELPELDFKLEDSWFREPENNKYDVGFIST